LRRVGKKENAEKFKNEPGCERLQRATEGGHKKKNGARVRGKRWWRIAKEKTDNKGRGGTAEQNDEEKALLNYHKKKSLRGYHRRRSPKRRNHIAARKIKMARGGRCTKKGKGEGRSWETQKSVGCRRPLSSITSWEKRGMTS